MLSLAQLYFLHIVRAAVIRRDQYWTYIDDDSGKKKQCVISHKSVDSELKKRK